MVYIKTSIFIFIFSRWLLNKYISLKTRKKTRANTKTLCQMRTTTVQWIPFFPVHSHSYIHQNTNHLLQNLPLELVLIDKYTNSKETSSLILLPIQESTIKKTKSTMINMKKLKLSLHHLWVLLADLINTKWKILGLATIIFHKFLKLEIKIKVLMEEQFSVLLKDGKTKQIQI